MSTPGEYSGLWHSFYRYPSSGRGNDAMWGRHILQAMQDGDALHFESVPDSKSRVVIDVTMGAERVATGTWREETDPRGYYQGAVYDGTIELRPSADDRRLEGTWWGRGKGGEMNSDIWHLVRDGVEPPGQTE